MFEVGCSTRFRAFHRMPDQPPPEDELHPHEYRVEVRAERERLDDRGMVCDLDVLTASLDAVVDRLREYDVSEVCATDVVTVEVLAAWIVAELTEPVRGDGAEVLAVRVWESDDAFGGVRERL